MLADFWFTKQFANAKNTIVLYSVLSSTAKKIKFLPELSVAEK